MQFAASIVVPFIDSNIADKRFLSVISVSITFLRVLAHVIDACPLTGLAVWKFHSRHTDRCLYDHSSASICQCIPSRYLTVCTKKDSETESITMEGDNLYKAATSICHSW